MKNRSSVRITRELMSSLFNLPANVEVTHVVYDSDREIVNFYLASDEAVDGVTFPISEGAEIPSINPFNVIAEESHSCCGNNCCGGENN